MITLALVGLASMVVLPLYEVSSTRLKEAELRQSLRIIRAGLDAYKAAADAGTLARVAGDSGYPPTLEQLTESLEVATRRDPSEPPQRIVILRQLPRDPFFQGSPEVPAGLTWNTRSYASRPDDPQPGADVFDVSSQSARVGLDGTPYGTW